MGKMRGFLSVLVLLLLFIPFALSAPPYDYVISNSQDWRDVYSIELFTNLIKSSPFFLVSQRHSTLLLNQLERNKNALVISSDSLPYVLNYANMLEAKGITAEELVFNNVNIDIGDRLDVSNFIVIDDRYGYNAVAVAPYAVVRQSYVLFANKGNIDEIVRFLSTRERIDELIIYGIVDREVIDTLSSFNPEIINEGDRFSNDIEMVKRYQAVKPSKQAIFTNGEFIESEIVSGSNPVIFIGKSNVPDVVQEYIPNSGIDIGVLIGNDLVGTATILRRTLGISVFVKFAQGARDPSGPISKVEALDMYNLPKYNVLLDIISMIYNSATNMIEITYQNTGGIAGYVKGTITLTGDQGEKQVVGDIDPFFIEAGSIKTMTYQVDPFASDKITGKAFVIFGEAPKSLEFLLEKTVELSKVSVADKSSLNITGVYYDSKSHEFIISVQNLGDTDAYFTAEIIGLKVGYETNNYGTKQVELIKARSEREVRIKVDNFLDEDIGKNPKVTLKLYYGERENALVNRIEGEFEVKIKTADYTIWIISGAIIILLLFFLLLKLRVKCDNCRHKNFIWRSRCSKCQSKL